MKILPSKSCLVVGVMWLAAAGTAFPHPLDWCRVRNSGTSNALAAVAYGNDVFVAVGLDGIWSSPDGREWTPGLNASGGLRAVTHGQGMFVAVGNAGTILTSADGMDWWPEFSGIETALNGVAYGNGLFVTVGTAGTILTSEDGLMWTEQISGSANVLEAVSYGNGVFVAVGGNGVLTSSDGTTWSQREPLRLNGIAFGNGMFVGVSRHHLCDCPGQGTLDIGFVVASADGITWTPPQITGRELSKVGFGNGTFVAVGGSCGFCGFGGGCGNILLSSTDGTNWISRPAPTTEFLQGVAFGQGTFVAVGANGVIIQSGSFTPGELSGPRALGGGEMQLSVAGEIGRTYRLQTTTNLSPPGWTDLHSFTLSAPTTNLVDATSGNFTSRFYRLVSP